MIFTDGDDVLASPSCDPATIAKRFMDRPRAASPILFSAERMVWPIWQWKSIYEDDIKNSSKFVHIPEGGRDPRKTVRRIQSYTRGLYEYTKYPFEYPFEFPHGRHGFSQDPKQSTTFRYLNAGTLVGRALDARAFLGEAYINECGDDQARFAELFLGGGVKVRKESARKVIEAMEKAEVEVEMAVDELEKELILWSKRGGTFGVDVERRVEEVEKARRRLRGFVVEMDKVDREVDESVLDANGALEGVRRPFIDLDFENHMTSALFAVWSVDMEMSEMGRKSLRMYETQPSLKDFGVVNQGEKGLWDRIERALGPGGAVETEEEVGGGRGICVFHQNGRKYENRVLEWMARGFGMWYREDTMGKDGLALNNPGVE
ncbi:hypothetical protein BC829DRAFT_176156 [Chytridium lagenaria]|nr:hypothetical protein BC829DRAFT_176156 [Chytridium lagenaria]